MSKTGKKYKLLTILDENKASPESVHSDYESNQYSADLKYKNSQWFIEGKVAQVRSGIGGVPYLIFKTGDKLPHQSVKAQFVESEYDYLAKLKNGQNVFLSCLGAGVIMDGPEFKRCTAVNVDTIKDYLVMRFDDFFAGRKSLPFSGQDYAIQLIATFSGMDKASCQVVDKECGKAYEESYAAMLKATDEWNRWAQFLIDKGVKLNLIKAN